MLFCNTLVHTDYVYMCAQRC